MKVKVLGCSGGELPFLNMPAFLVDEVLLLDAGTIGLALDQMEQGKLRNLFITHAHLDHVKALPFFADNIVSNAMKIQLNVLSEARVVKVLREHLFNWLIWPDFSVIPSVKDGVLRFREVQLGEPVEVEGHKVTAYPVNHPTPAVGFLVVDREGKRLFYSGDTGPTDIAWKEMEGTRLDGLIIEVSFPNRQKQRALVSGHLTPELLAVELAKIRPRPERILITHSKPAFREEIHDELQKMGIADFLILKDGDMIWL